MPELLRHVGKIDPGLQLLAGIGMAKAVRWADANMRKRVRSLPTLVKPAGFWAVGKTLKPDRGSPTSVRGLRLSIAFTGTGGSMGPPAPPPW